MLQPEALLAQPVEIWTTILALTLLVSIFASKASGRLGVPVLLAFLVIGMGAQVLGIATTDNARAAQTLGVIALAFILFAGGLETNWSFVRPNALKALLLSTFGVLITALLMGVFAHYVLGLGWTQGLLLGAIVSSTDAAAVFSILRARGVTLREDLAATLELESGSNDPMAVFLTTTFILWLGPGGMNIPVALLSFTQQMILGLIVGAAIGVAAVYLINHTHLEYDGLYPVITIAVALVAYGFIAVLGGNGFLGVYVAGIVMGNRNFIGRRRLTRFHDGLAWLMQIAMFLTLGLLVTPGRILDVAWPSLAAAFFLMVVARPVAVFSTLAFSGIDLRGLTMISWVGLRGAVPIILATFPLLAGVTGADALFHAVFFIVLTSVLLQGSTVAPLARLLKVDKPAVIDRSPSEVPLAKRTESELTTIAVPDRSRVAGKRVVEMNEWPRDSLILVLYRGNEFFIPDGGTRLESGDRLIVLTNKTSVDLCRKVVDAAPG
jgi:potassium/hydrogen antiporter